MCLTIEIHPYTNYENNIGSISNVDGALFVSEVRNWRGKPKGKFTISNDGEGCCACNMLTDDADWDNKYWDINQEDLVALAFTVNKVSGLCPEGFEFAALWAGDKIEKTKLINIQDFIEIIKSNKIENKTQYKITSAEPAASVDR